MKVGFIGVGNIGRPMAERLLAAPFEPTIFDVAPSALEPFKGKAYAAQSPAALGERADLIGICVRHDGDVLEVMNGANGLMSALKPGAIVAIHSTIRPVTVHRLAEQARARHAHVIDAAVSGGPAGAASGTLVCMVGGESELLERARPMLQAHSKTIIHAGTLGTGMALKLSNNLVTYMHLLSTVEGFRLAKAGGVEDRVLRQVMAANGNLTTTMSQYLEFSSTGGDKIGAAAYAAHRESTCGLAEKDLEFALALAADTGIALPGTEAVRRLIRAALESR